MVYNVMCIFVLNYLIILSKIFEFISKKEFFFLEIYLMEKVFCLILRFI